MISCLRRAVPAFLTVVLAGSGLGVTVAPVHARADVDAADAPIPTPPKARGITLDTDWGDGARAGREHGRVGAKFARTTTVNPASGPDFELPFACGQRWIGSTRSSHSPSAYSIDFNTSNDLGRPVLASAPGIVVKAVSLTSSYGRYVVIDHGRGYSTLYAHMNAIAASVGTYVDQGDMIGYVGSSGNSTGPHLHFEQRLDGAYFAPYFHRTRFPMGSTATSLTCHDRPVTGDWDGDGVTDLGVFRTGPTSGVYYQRLATSTRSLAWGAVGDRPVVGDFDGDRLAQVAVRRLEGTTWVLRSRTGAAATVRPVGNSADTPLSGDWDGNGRASLGMYRTSNKRFYMRTDQGTYATVSLGSAGDRPIIGDWNGDGKDDVGVFRPSNVTWYLRISRGTSYTLTRVAYARGDDIPITGDWNGDGVTDIGVWRPSTAQFFRRIPTSVPGTYASVPDYFGSRR